MPGGEYLTNNWVLFLTSFIGGCCAVGSYQFYRELNYLKRVRSDLDEQGEVAPMSVREVMNGGKSIGKKYIVVSGVVMAFESDQIKDKGLLENNLKNINRKEPIAEVLYKN